MKRLDPVLEARLETLIRSMGCDLYGCEILPQGRQIIFRIYIDSLEKDPTNPQAGGVTADDCSAVSRQVSAMIDVEGLFQGQYTLEVSSPGIDRRLFKLKHYQDNVGNQVKIKLHHPINQQRQFECLLKQVVGDDVTFIVDKTMEEIKVSFSEIEKANLVNNIQF